MSMEAKPKRLGTCLYLKKYQQYVKCETPCDYYCLFYKPDRVMQSPTAYIPYCENCGWWAKLAISENYYDMSEAILSERQARRPSTPPEYVEIAAIIEEERSHR